jgi:hypothetical protein
VNGSPLIAASAAFALIAGCATRFEGPGFDVLSTSAATAPLPADAVYPPLAGVWVYAVTAGDGAGASLAAQRAATDRYAAAWVNHEPDRRSEYWRADEAGNLVMPVVVDHANNAITFFDPPLIVAYGQLEPNRTYEQEASMRVMDAKRPLRRRYAGTGTQTIEYADDQVLKTPLGEFSTKRLKIRFAADLGTARAETTTTLWVVPGVGPLVVQRHQVERLLGILGRDRDQTLVLTSSPVPLPLPLPRP